MEKIDVSMEEFLDYWQEKWPYATRDVKVLERSAHFRGCCDAWFAARQDKGNHRAQTTNSKSMPCCPNCKTDYDVGVFHVCENCGHRWA